MLGQPFKCGEKDPNLKIEEECLHNVVNIINYMVMLMCVGTVLVAWASVEGTANFARLNG